MEFLQRQPSEISIHEDATRLVLQERSQIHWLLGILGFWAIVGAAVAGILMVVHAPSWLAVLVLILTLVAAAMTLISWAVLQTCIFDTTNGSVIVTQTGLLGKGKLNQYALHEIQTVQLIPKTGRNSLTYYISLEFSSGRQLEIDLTSSEAVDREIVRRMQRFLNFQAHHFVPQDADSVKSFK